LLKLVYKLVKDGMSIGHLADKVPLY